MRFFGDILRTYRVSKQKTAYLGHATIVFCCDSVEPCKRHFAAGCSSKHPPATCQHRYPSPCRSVQFQVRPADGVWAWAKTRPFSRTSENPDLALRPELSDSEGGAHIWKGRKQCLRLLGLLPLRLSSALQAVSTTMLSVPSQGPVLAALQAKFLIMTAPQAPLLAASPVRLPTTSKVSAAKAAQQHSNQMNAAGAGPWRRFLV